MIVMKFGGTSVEDTVAIRRLAKIVGRHLERRPIVVVSAMGKTTNELLKCAQLAAEIKLSDALTALSAIEHHHLRTLDELNLPAKHTEPRTELIKLFEHLRELLKEVGQQGQLCDQLSDAIAAHGELLSSVIVTAALRVIGINSIRVDIRPLMRTNNRFKLAEVDFPEANDKLEAGFRPLLDDSCVPVTQGFIGATADGITTTIGRGGSDYSASIIGAALNAEEIQIWTDVDGIMTSDPRVIPEAAKIKTLSFAEASELAYFGAKVLHPRTLRPLKDAEKNRTVISVRNSRRPDDEGTIILHDAPVSNAPIKAIAFKRGITVITVTSDQMLMEYGYLASLFEVFKKHETSVDLLATTEVSVSMSLDDMRNINAIKQDLEVYGEVDVRDELVLICVVGEQINRSAGLAARIFSSIKDINILMTSQGMLATNVSFIVERKDFENAVKALHKEFFSELDAATFVAPSSAQTAQV